MRKSQMKRKIYADDHTMMRNNYISVTSSLSILTYTLYNVLPVLI